MKIRSILLIALVVSGITLVKGKDVKPQICYFNSEVKKKEADGIFSKAATLLANRKTNKKLSFFEIVSQATKLEVQAALIGHPKAILKFCKQGMGRGAPEPIRVKGTSICKAAIRHGIQDHISIHSDIVEHMENKKDYYSDEASIKKYVDSFCKI